MKMRSVLMGAVAGALLLASPLQAFDLWRSTQVTKTGNFTLVSVPADRCILHSVIVGSGVANGIIGIYTGQNTDNYKQFIGSFSVTAPIQYDFDVMLSSGLFYNVMGSDNPKITILYTASN